MMHPSTRLLPTVALTETYDFILQTCLATKHNPPPRRTTNHVITTAHCFGCMFVRHATPLASRFNLHLLDDNHDSLLHLAAGSNDLHLCEYLLAQGVSTRGVNLLGLTPRRAAELEGNWELGLWLGGRGAPRVSPIHVHFYPLHAAVLLQDHDRVAALLCDDGCDLSVTADTTAATAAAADATSTTASSGAHGGNSGIPAAAVTMLDIDLQDFHHNTPLHLAVAVNDAPLVELLVSRGADLALRNKPGMSPLQLAISLQHDVVASVLCRGNASLTSDGQAAAAAAAAGASSTSGRRRAAAALEPWSRLSDDMMAERGITAADLAALQGSFSAAAAQDEEEVLQAMGTALLRHVQQHEPVSSTMFFRPRSGQRAAPSRASSSGSRTGSGASVSAGRRQPSLPLSGWWRGPRAGSVARTDDSLTAQGLEVGKVLATTVSKASRLAELQRYVQQCVAGHVNTNDGVSRDDFHRIARAAVVVVKEQLARDEAWEATGAGVAWQKFAGLVADLAAAAVSGAAATAETAGETDAAVQAAALSVRRCGKPAASPSKAVSGNIGCFACFTT